MKKTRRKEEPSSIAWGWVMETLADLKKVDTPLIDDLLSKVPCGSDSLSSGAKERLALRRLDELFASTSIASSKRSSPASDTTVIDVSKSAKDVYNHLASIKEASSSRASMLDSFKLEAHKFALQKRACLPKCVIQQLEEVLTEGGRPYISVLRGTSEEVVEKLDQIRNAIIARTQELNATRSVAENQGKCVQEDISARPSSSTRKKVRFADESPIVHYTDDIANDTEQRADVGEVHPTNEIATSSIPENQTEDLRDGHGNDVVAPHKRTRSEVAKEQHTHIKDSGRMDRAEHISDPMTICESSKSCNENTLSYDQNGATTSANGRLVEQLQDNIDVVDEDVGDGERLPKRTRVSSDAIDHQQPGFTSSVNDTHQEAPEGRLCSNNCQTDLEAPRGNVEHSGKGTQVQDLQEDLALVVNDIGRGTQACQEALQDGLCGRNCQTEQEGLISNAGTSGKGTQIQNLQGNVIVDDDDVDGGRVSNRWRVGTNLTIHGQPGFIGSSVNTRQKTPLNGPRGNGNQTELESSRGNVEHPDRVSLVSSTNMTGAQSTLNQDSIGTDWPEKKTCAKCNGGDQLLECSSSACFVAVHERCLGCPATLDSAGNFYCPYCTFCRANLACYELAEKFAEAKKNAHLAKKRFNQFMQNEAST